MEDFEFEIKSINEYGQVLIEFIPLDMSLRTHIVNIQVPNVTLENVSIGAIKAYVSQFSPQNKWIFEKKFQTKPVLNIQHIGVAGDETDIP